MDCYIALPYLSIIKPSDISITRSLGSGDAGDVYEGRIASYADGNAVALKVFKAYRYPNYGYILSKAGYELSPFDRELKAYSVINGDPEAKVNSPVIEAYGWFEVPPELCVGRFQISEKDPLKVIVKKVVEGPHFNFNLVTPEQMIEHRNILNRLQIYDTDIKEDNFLIGRLVDLSATYVLSDLMRPQSYDINDQYRHLKGAILRHHGVFSKMSLPSSELVEKEWEIFLEKFMKDPGMLSRAADQHRAQTFIVKIY